jgi:spore maturation protein CgeB
MGEITATKSPAKLILYLGADWWGSDARALAVALRKQGDALIEVTYEDFLPLQWSSFPLRVIRRLAAPLFVRNYNDAVLRHASNSALDFVLVFKGKLLQAASLDRFHKQGTPLYCFYPDVSYRDHGPGIWDCLPLYECVFTTKSFHLADPTLRRRVKDLRLVSHGCDPEVHRPIQLTDRIKAEYGCDVSFIGCWSPKKEALLGAVIEQCPALSVRIWGPGWGRARAVVQRFWQRRGAYGDELAIIYGASRINLGLLSEAGGGTQSGDLVTARTWQIPAAGGFLLHENTPELGRYFEPGREVGVFESATDLPAKVAHYVQAEAERTQLRNAGLRRYQESGYTYDMAARTILEYHSSSRRR